MYTCAVLGQRDTLKKGHKIQMKETADMTKKIIAMIAAILVAISFSEPAEVYADDLEWGYGNPDKGVIWVLDNGTMTVYLNNDSDLPRDSLAGFPDGLPAPDSEEEKAITQLFKNTGTEKRDSYRKISGNKLDFTDGGALKNKVKKIVIRDGITGIGWKAKWDNTSYVPPYGSDYAVSQLNTGVFQDFDKLEAVKTCSSVKRIGWSAFRRCSALSDFDFGSLTALEEIMNQAFSPCNELTTIDLSKCKQLTTIRQNAFYESNNISGVILPDGLKTVGKGAFKSCNSLDYVKFGDTSKVEMIGEEAFQGTSNNNRSKLAFVTDEKTQRKAVVNKATPKLFNDNVLPSADHPDNVFWFGALEEYLWDLDVTVKDKTVAYSGEEQKGYGVSEVTGTGSDPVETEECKVTGLHEGHVLTLTGYTPSSGTDPKRDPYDKGSYNSDPGIKAWYDNYDYGINYVLGTKVPGTLTIQPVVTFVDDDGTTVLKEATPYAFDTQASSIVKPDDPTKQSTAQYNYTFDGWEPAIADVTGNATYKAKYMATLRQYDVRFVNDDGTVLQETQEEYGSMPSYKGSTPAKPETDRYTYTFSGWTPAISEVTGAVTYTAEFTANVKPDPEPEPTPVPDPEPEPTPAPDTDPTPGQRTTPASNNTARPAAGGNNVTPAVPADGGTVIPDGTVPQADSEEPESIPDEPVPQTEPGTGAWALLNLIMTILTVIGAILAILRRKEDDDDDDSSRPIMLAAKIVSIILAILAPVIFFLTEDMTQPRIMTDRFTWLMALILAIQIAAAAVIKRASESYETDEEE